MKIFVVLVTSSLSSSFTENCWKSYLRFFLFDFAHECEICDLGHCEKKIYSIHLPALDDLKCARDSISIGKICAFDVIEQIIQVYFFINSFQHGEGQ